ncbi:Pectate lyase L [Colletotrichum spinosum]|uniref:Pectate lyase L n=1 Tax=Colletotrichum spinosum TaxID=1347390 RepID=A0A4R8Q5Q2_9PEZI|nr:Pectate lyase L [Colletotrichum spinosum]
MLLLPTLISFLPLALAANLYVAPTGDPTPDGTSKKPLGDIQATVDISQPGNVIILRGVLHVESVHHWNFQRLTFTHGLYGVYVKDSGNLRFNQVVTRDNYESGFHMQGALSNDVISYLDSYGNRDPRNSSENADGIAFKEGKGEGNIVVGSRFWDNSDDGVDFCIAWGNGYNRWNLADFTGNGNGFKLGGGSAGDILPARFPLLHLLHRYLYMGHQLACHLVQQEPEIFFSSSHPCHTALSCVMESSTSAGENRPWSGADT